MKHKMLFATVMSAAAGAALALPVLAQAPYGDPWGGGYGYGHYGPEARVWVEDDGGRLDRGDRLRVNFSTSADAHVAVVHIDPEGRLEFLFPRSPYDATLVRGGEIYSLPRGSGFNRGRLIRSGGIGYLYILASPIPFEYGALARGQAWDWSYGGQFVRGDPFWAMEQVTRVLLPQWGYVPFVNDYYSYHVGGLHRYPSYACSTWDGVRDWGWGWGWGYSPVFGGCRGIDRFLHDYPYYFDALRFRGDRRSLFLRYGRDDPRHGYKEPPDARYWDDDLSRDRYYEDSRSGARGVYRPQQPADGPQRAVTPERRRPTLQRRGDDGEASSRGVAGPDRRSTQPERRQAAPRRSGGSSEAAPARPATPERRTPKRRPS